MKSYLKLVNMELNRFYKIYISLFLMTILVQVIGVIVTAKSYMKGVDKKIIDESLSVAEYVQNYGMNDFSYYLGGLWFNAPIALAVAACLFYLFFIWYRDWLGKNTFIYRLLMLPMSRMSVYMAKVSTILLIVLGLVGLEIVLLPVLNSIFNGIVPTDLRTLTNFSLYVNSSIITTIIIPPTLIQFLLYYGAGLMVVFILFTAVLCERSFRWKGAILGIVYSVAAVALFFSPLYTLIFTDRIDYFYNSELIYIQIGSGLIVSTISVLFSRYLINKKVTV